MRWKDLRRSDNVEDERRIQPAGIAIGGGIGTLVIVLIALFLGADPQKVLRLLQAEQKAAPGQPQVKAPLDPAEEERVDFVKAVLGSTEDVWEDLFRSMGRDYQVPHLKLFTGQTRSGCGAASSAVGPFYCPADEMVYIDLSFYRELTERFHAPGDFAEAYVLAHEVGHHVQNLLGISRKVQVQQQRLSEAEANQLSVKLELQADFLAGVWANHAQAMKQIIEKGDVQGALRAATAIGDDKLQREARGYVRPDTFTHGTSEQRVRWFSLGLRTGDINQGDTFTAASL